MLLCITFTAVCTGGGRRRSRRHEYYISIYSVALRVDRRVYRPAPQSQHQVSSSTQVVGPIYELPEKIRTAREFEKAPQGVSEVQKQSPGKESEREGQCLRQVGGLLHWTDDVELGYLSPNRSAVTR